MSVTIVERWKCDWCSLEAIAEADSAESARLSRDWVDTGAELLCPDCCESKRAAIVAAREKRTGVNA